MNQDATQPAPAIAPIAATDALAQSADIVSANIAQLKALFPELVTEGKDGAAINVDVLKQLVGDKTVTEADEKYGLNWHGKRRARQLALTPSTGTLRPCPDESVDWDTTQNLMIEGDNLEVLKLLQKSYAGKVKLIYIDPPYNTGKDFVYPDNFQDSIKNYLELTGQVEGGAKISSNTEASGRFHTDWLNLMLPRLTLARTLLREDGVLFISIDDVEVANLREACESVFGAENFVAELIWEGANKNDAKQIGIAHEYVLVYAKRREALPREWGLRKEGVELVLEEVERLKQKHGEDFDAASTELAGWFRAMKATPSFGLRRFRYIDKRGAYKEDDPTAPGGRRFDLRNPKNGKIIPLRRNRGWGFDQAEFNRLVDDGRISFVTESSIMVRRYLHETDSITPPSVFYQPARSASERLTKLMDSDVFDFPKDETIIAKFIEMVCPLSKTSDLVVDFFAGSGTSAHAVMNQNAFDDGNRRYVLVQLPEPLDPENTDQMAAAGYCDKLGRPRNIAELTKERLRRAGAKIKADNPMFSGDTGFRVYKLDQSNICAWQPSGNLEQDLIDNVEHILPHRSEADVLTELLLKLGLDLCVPIEQKTIAGKTVHSIGGGVLIACLDPRIAEAEAEPLALGIAQWHDALKPAGDTTCVFRDNAFANDVAKTNLAVILDQHGIAQVRSL
ncbi:MAG: site-specific DNA-methyltransferase [Proteobacteria bacterium]|nr:site-specific DNA-methyltransferase [Pseudomonadota bacterium]